MEPYFEQRVCSYGEIFGEERTDVAVLSDSGIASRSIFDGSPEPSAINTQVQPSVSQRLLNTASGTLVSQSQNNSSLLGEQPSIQPTNRWSTTEGGDSKSISFRTDKRNRWDDNDDGAVQLILSLMSSMDYRDRKRQKKTISAFYEEVVEHARKDHGIEQSVSNWKSKF